MPRRRRAFITAATGALLAWSAPTAHAQIASRDFFVCGGNAFNTCAAVALTVTPTATSGLSDVSMRVWNLSGMNGTFGGTVFTKIGFFNTGAALALGPLSMSGPVRIRNGTPDTPAQWQLADPNNAGGVSLELTTSANGTNSSVKNSLAGGCDPASLPGGKKTSLWQNPCATDFPTAADAGWITMSFQVQGVWDLQTTEMLIQAQNGPGGLSAQCITAENCASNVVPEPATVFLLATGLLGLAGAGLRRRREDAAFDGAA